MYHKIWALPEILYIRILKMPVRNKAAVYKPISFLSYARGRSKKRYELGLLDFLEHIRVGSLQSYTFTRGRGRGIDLPKEGRPNTRAPRNRKEGV